LYSRAEKLQAWLGIEPPTIDLSCQSGAFDLSATAATEILSAEVFGGIFWWVRKWDEI